MDEEEMVDRTTNYYLVQVTALINNQQEIFDVYSQKLIPIDIEFIEDIENKLPTEIKEQCSIDDFRRQVICQSIILNNKGKNHTHILHLRIATAKKVSEDIHPKRIISANYTPDRPYNQPDIRQN